jgi:hypothetical protein
MRVVLIALLATLLLAAPALADDAVATRAASLAGSVSALSERVALLEREVGQHSVRLASSDSVACQGWQSPFSGSVTLRTEFSRQGGREDFRQRLGFELNYFRQITDDFSFDLSLEKPVSGRRWDHGFGFGDLDDDLRLGSAFFRLQVGEMEAGAREDSE